MFRVIASILITTAVTVTAQAQPIECNAPAASPSVTISLPGPPFMVQPSKEGCWVFVSLIDIHLEVDVDETIPQWRRHPCRSGTVGIPVACGNDRPPFGERIFTELAIFCGEGSYVALNEHGGFFVVPELLSAT